MFRRSSQKVGDLATQTKKDDLATQTKGTLSFLASQASQASQALYAMKKRFDDENKRKKGLEYDIKDKINKIEYALAFNLLEIDDRKLLENKLIILKSKKTLFRKTPLIASNLTIEEEERINSLIEKNKVHNPTYDNLNTTPPVPKGLKYYVPTDNVRKPSSKQLPDVPIPSEIDLRYQTKYNPIFIKYFNDRYEFLIAYSDKIVYFMEILIRIYKNDEIYLFSFVKEKKGERQLDMKNAIYDKVVITNKGIGTNILNQQEMITYITNLFTDPFVKNSANNLFKPADLETMFGVPSFKSPLYNLKNYALQLKLLLSKSHTQMNNRLKDFQTEISRIGQHIYADNQHENLLKYIVTNEMVEFKNIIRQIFKVIDEIAHSLFFDKKLNPNDKESIYRILDSFRNEIYKIQEFSYDTIIQILKEVKVFTHEHDTTYKAIFEEQIESKYLTEYLKTNQPPVYEHKLPPSGGRRKPTKPTAKKPKKSNHADMNMKDIRRLCKANQIKLSTTKDGVRIIYKKKELITKLKRKKIL
jgi:hypothetical protein